MTLTCGPASGRGRASRGESALASMRTMVPQRPAGRMLRLLSWGHDSRAWRRPSAASTIGGIRRRRGRLGIRRRGRGRPCASSNCRSASGGHSAARRLDDPSRSSSGGLQRGESAGNCLGFSQRANGSRERVIQRRGRDASEADPAVLEDNWPPATPSANPRRPTSAPYTHDVDAALGPSPGTTVLTQLSNLSILPAGAAGTIVRNRCQCRAHRADARPRPDAGPPGQGHAAFPVFTGRSGPRRPDRSVSAAAKPHRSAPPLPAEGAALNMAARLTPDASRAHP